MQSACTILQIIGLVLELTLLLLLCELKSKRCGHTYAALAYIVIEL